MKKKINIHLLRMLVGLITISGSAFITYILRTGFGYYSIATIATAIVLVICYFVGALICDE